ncbi:hypothetical protein E7811_01705 [Aliigemmobacter aestuarii]|uniref:Tetratricopeptide repeat protein n=1 Tax=Aliigemmobacter aestuarii TaxID=1445661 RepID=A0A4S3MPR8_9RHOB|nr:hypothetical protein [Gemmobacter aestuarii]THD84486.1 hypothetical protein E7811_01705 [Gemmobacter aestuarii]
MSQPDSFIEEVSEEVRRDKLFALFRKYGWIGVLLVVLTVGGAAWNEWQKSTRAASAQAFGDAILTALDAETPEARRTAIAGIDATGDKAAIRALLLASDPTEDRAASLAALQALAEDPALPVVYRDLAILRRVILLGAEAPVADRHAALDPIAAPGRPYRPLALEQLAYLLVEEGKKDEAVAALRALTEDQAAPEGLRQRASQMIVALGGETAEG